MRRTFLTILGLAFLFAGSLHSAESKRILLVGQEPDNHPKGTHEYTAGMRILEKCLQGVSGIEVTRVQANGKWAEGPDLVGRSDGVVLFVSQGAQWIANDPARYRAFANLAKRGGGIVVLHWGMGTREAKNIAPFLKLFGGCHGGPDRKYKVLTTELAIQDHPIARGVKSLEVKDEFYYKLKFVRSDKPVVPVAKAKIDGNVETVAWAWQRPDGGRSFGFSGLHFHDNWKFESYRRLVTQATLWSVGVPIPKAGLPVKVTPADLKVQDSDR